LVTRLQALSPVRIALEAGECEAEGRSLGGRYERAAVQALRAAGLRVVVVNPYRSRRFAQSQNYSAKTDRIDARVLAHFAEGLSDPERIEPDEATEELEALRSRRDQWVANRTAEHNRLGTAHPAQQESIQNPLDWLTEEIESVEQQLQERIQQSEDFQEKDRLIRSVPGVGPMTSLALLGALPELGLLSRKEIAALVGVAPFNRDSGSFRGKRSIRGGRASVRKALYMATWAGIRHNSMIKAHYQQLREAGKPFKVALVACMRKLLLLLNSLLKHGQSWDPQRYARSVSPLALSPPLGSVVPALS
jgi:transposase